MQSDSAKIYIAVVSHIGGTAVWPSLQISRKDPPVNVSFHFQLFIPSPPLFPQFCQIIKYRSPQNIHKKENVFKINEKGEKKLTGKM